MYKIYEVLSSKLDALRARITRINKIARKLNVTPITLTALRTFIEVDADATRKARKWDANAPDVMRERTEVRIDGETPKLGGYTFVARIDPDGIVFGAPDAPDVPNALVDRRGACDHCGLDRKRSATFAVANEDGEMTLVGRNCLGDFMGAFANDPHMVWKFLEDFESLTRDASDPDSAFGSKGDAMFSPLAVLTATFKVIKTHGWLAAGVAFNNPGIGKPTASRVRGLLFETGKYADKARAEVATVILDTDRINGALEWARTVEGDSDYIRNIRTLANAKAVGYKHIGFVASIIPAHDKAMERETERVRKAEAREALPESNWVGDIGNRITIKYVTLDNIRELDGNFGITYLHKMTDADGNELVWFASKNNLCKVGDTINMTATVKRHGEFNGRKNTVVNRAKVA